MQHKDVEPVLGAVLWRVRGSNPACAIVLVWPPSGRGSSAQALDLASTDDNASSPQRKLSQSGFACTREVRTSESVVDCRRRITTHS
jgi:hypothetical protein